MHFALLQTSNDPLLQKFMETNLLPFNFSQTLRLTYEVLFEEMYRDGGKIAVLADERETDFRLKDFFSSKKEDAAVKMDEPLSSIHQSFAIKRRSPYTNLFSYR